MCFELFGLFLSLLALSALAFVLQNVNRKQLLADFRTENAFREM